MSFEITIANLQNIKTNIPLAVLYLQPHRDCMYRIFISVLFLGLLHSAFCQGEGPSGGAASTLALAKMNTAISGIESMYHNHTQLLRLKNGWGLDAGMEQRFGLSELNTISLGSFIKRENDCFSLNITRFGFQAYSEQMISFGYARKMLDNFYFGAKINHLSYFTDGFGSTSIVTTDLGLTARISPAVWISGLIRNPVNITISSGNVLPSVLSAGMQYLAGKKVSILLEAEKIIDRDVALRLGVLYDAADQVDIRVGVDLSREIFGVGFGYRFQRNTRVRGAFSMHSLLGVSPALSIQYHQSK